MEEVDWFLFSQVSKAKLQMKQRKIFWHAPVELHRHCVALPLLASRPGTNKCMVDRLLHMVPKGATACERSKQLIMHYALCRILVSKAKEEQLGSDYLASHESTMCIQAPRCRGSRPTRCVHDKTRRTAALASHRKMLSTELVQVDQGEAKGQYMYIHGNEKDPLSGQSKGG